MKNKIEIKNPCIDKCKYDEDKVCMACHRNIHEIVNWQDFTDKEKLIIINRITKKIKKNL